jgi:hypothetical protein
MDRAMRSFGLPPGFINYTHHSEHAYIYFHLGEDVAAREIGQALDTHQGCVANQLVDPIGNVMITPFEHGILLTSIEMIIRVVEGKRGDGPHRCTRCK